MKQTTEKRIAAAYIRVSTHDQEEYSPESQIKEIHKYARQHNMVLAEDLIFQDDGINGKRAEKRPEFMRLISMAKEPNPPFQVVLLWKFSRFARNQEESIVYKSMLRKKCNIDVISVSEPIIEGPFGALIERIIEWQDEYYSINLGTEVRRGMAERASRGEVVSAPPFGYGINSEKELVAIPEEADIVRMIFRDFLSGKGSLAIARKLNSLGIKTKRGNAWENRTVYYVLRNPVYIGKIRWCKSGINDYHTHTLREDTMLVDGVHAPLISVEDFEQAQEIISDTLRKYKSASGIAQRQEVNHMLQGLVKCGACGATLTRTGTGMNCVKYVHGKCSVSHFLPLEKTEKLVLAILHSQLENLSFELVHREKPRLVGEQQRLQQQLKKEETILQRHREAYAAGIDSLEEYRTNKNESTARIQKLREALEESDVSEVNREEFARKNLELLPTLEDPTVSPQEKNSILRSFVDHITFHKDGHVFEIVFYA